MRNITNSLRKKRPTWRLHTKYFGFSQIVFTMDREKRKYECKYLHEDGTFFHRTCVVLVQALEKHLQKPNLANHGDKLQQSGIVISFDNHVTSQHASHIKNREFSYSLRFARYLFDYTRAIYPQLYSISTTKEGASRCSKMAVENQRERCKMLLVK